MCRNTLSLNKEVLRTYILDEYTIRGSCVTPNTYWMIHITISAVYETRQVTDYLSRTSHWRMKCLTAGTESNANTTSLSSTQTRQRSKGVAIVIPSTTVKNLYRAERLQLAMKDRISLLVIFILLLSIELISGLQVLPCYLDNSVLRYILIAQ